jgi:Tfp pilus assembly protein PilV
MEVLVAMTIMGIGLLVILSGFVEGSRARRNAYLQTRAVFLSHQVMDTWLAEAPLEAGGDEGSWEEEPLYSWSMEVTPYNPEGADEDEPPLMELTLTTRWPDGESERSVVLKSLAPAVEE